MAINYHGKLYSPSKNGNEMNDFIKFQVLKKMDIETITTKQKKNIASKIILFGIAIHEFKKLFLGSDDNLQSQCHSEGEYILLCAEMKYFCSIAVEGWFGEFALLFKNEAEEFADNKKKMDIILNVLEEKLKKKNAFDVLRELQIDLIQYLMKIDKKKQFRYRF